MARRRRYNARAGSPVTIYTGGRSRRRARSYDGGDGNGWGRLVLYVAAGWLLYTNWDAWFGGAAATVPGGGGGAVPSYWVRAEDGQVVASHTGPPTTSTGDFGWGTWTPAGQATIDAANATASVVTIS